MDILYILEELPVVAARLLKTVEGRGTLALHGDMGAGKTTLTHALCTSLGVEGNVSSPTFALVNEYRTQQGETIFHLDWYRLKGEEEALQAGMEEYLYAGVWCLVEWPERAPGLLPEGTVHIYLEVVDPQTRRLRVLGPGTVR